MVQRFTPRPHGRPHARPGRRGDEGQLTLGFDAVPPAAAAAPAGREGPTVVTDTVTEGRGRGGRPAGDPREAARARLAAAAELHERLRRLGLRGIDRVRLTRNRTVMVSFSAGELRVHEGYVGAPAEVLKAVVGFVCGRTRVERRRAREAILAHQIPRAGAPPRRRERPRPEDAPVVEQLRRFHAHYNRLYFGARLRAVPIHLSGRMRTRLGHYTAASPIGEQAEIVISRDHLRRHGWEEVLHTLLHEMVHQWQDEGGHAIDHGTTFREKAKEVGITPSARRHVLPRRQRQLAPSAQQAIGLRAAREE